MKLEKDYCSDCSVDALVESIQSNLMEHSYRMVCISLCFSRSIIIYRLVLYFTSRRFS